MDGEALGTKLCELGHEVKMGARCAQGCARESLNGKVRIDIANPIDFSKGRAAQSSLSVSNTDSLGDQLERTFPEAHVVKALNTICAV